MPFHVKIFPVVKSSIDQMLHKTIITKKKLRINRELKQKRFLHKIMHLQIF